MKKIFKILVLLLLIVVAICGYSFLTDKTYYTKWEISRDKSDTSQISWAKFEWTNDTLFGKYYQKSLMLIPCKVEGLPYNFKFQFDLGCDLTRVYENSFSAFYKKYPAIQNKISRLRSPLQFWFNKKTFKNLNIQFGQYKATNKFSYIFSNYGEKLNLDEQTLNDTYNLGTIGVDIFQNKVLIIDYPNQQFAICDNVPKFYQKCLTDIELDVEGRVLLPMQLKGKKYKVLFDNGSSLFPLLTTGDKINTFSTLLPSDTIKGYAWGKPFTAIGRPLNDSFVIANQTFYKTTVYADYRKDFRTTDNTDAITGNILFWNKTIIIDFKNKKFGVQ
jgi:hypothetical protein